MRLSTVGLALLLLAAPAKAAHGAGGIALETLPKERGGERRVPPALLDELKEHGYLAGDDLARRLLAVHSRPAGELAPEAREEARARVQSGYKAYLRGEFELARTRTSRGLDALLAKPASLARDQELRSELYLAYVTLALASHRLEDRGRARWALESLVRSFPREEVSYSRFGPEARQLYLAARRRLEEEGKGSLRVEVEESDVMIFVDERYVSVGSMKERLYPGVYRLYLQRGERPGRIREVTVRAGATTELSLSWALEDALEVEGGRAAIRSGGGARGAAPLARELGRQLGLSRVLLAAVEERGGGQVVTAAYLEVGSGELIREARVRLEEGGQLGRERAGALARYVALGEPSPEVDVEVAASRGGRGEPSALPGIFVGAGAAGVGLGLVLVGIGVSRDCLEVVDDPRCGGTFGPTEIGLLSLGLGASAAAIGLFLWNREEKAERAPALSLVPTRDGARVGLSLAF